MADNFIDFETSSLLCKWGFNDGGILDDMIHKYFGYLLKNKEILCSVIRKFVVPRLEGEFEVSYSVSISHNPVRISKIDVEDLAHLWYNSDEKKPEIYPKIVSVYIPEIVLFIKDGLLNNEYFISNDSIIEIVKEYGICNEDVIY